MINNSGINVNLSPKCVGIDYCRAKGLTDNNSDINNFAQDNISFRGKREARYVLRWLSKNFSSPQQRAILGATALCTQPFIDLRNKHIKKEDKSVVVAKTIAKILVGTCIGVAIRHYSIKAVRQFTKTINAGKYSQALLPNHVLDNLKRNPMSVSDAELANYRNGLGTLLGVIGGLFTNFIIDAPLTKFMTNYINENIFMKGKQNAK